MFGPWAQAQGGLCVYIPGSSVGLKRSFFCDLTCFSGLQLVLLCDTIKALTELRRRWR